MFTRVEFDSGLCTRTEYFSQFVNTKIKNFVEKKIGLKNILSCKAIPPYWIDSLDLYIRNNVDANLWGDLGETKNISASIEIAMVSVEMIALEHVQTKEK